MFSGWTLRFKAGKGLLGRRLVLRVPKLGKQLEFPDLKSLKDLDFFADLECDSFGCFK